MPLGEKKIDTRTESFWVQTLLNSKDCLGILAISSALEIQILVTFVSKGISLEILCYTSYSQLLIFRDTFPLIFIM